jgi:protein involved in polysaccharide export with SLBB domain
MSEIYGVFNGEYMITSEKREYPVPANYASKSRLLPGDELKVSIQEDGEYIFKIVNQVPRKRVMADIVEDNLVKYNGKKYKLSQAVVSFYRLKKGDQVMALIPNILKGVEWLNVDGKIR